MANGHIKSKCVAGLKGHLKMMDTVISNFLQYTDKNFVFHIMRELPVLNFPQLYYQCKNQDACLDNLHDAVFNISFLGHTMTRAASHQPLIMEAWV